MSFFSAFVFISSFVLSNPASHFLHILQVRLAEPGC
jgi:hypothetical protein